MLKYTYINTYCLFYVYLGAINFVNLTTPEKIEYKFYIFLFFPQVFYIFHLHV